MIYVTGDTHGIHGLWKFDESAFPDSTKLSKKDYMIIAGDAAPVWSAGSMHDKEVQKFYADQNFTTLFVDGNHENFDLLNAYPVEEWNGGKVHRINKKLIHLMRGQVFTIDKLKFFTFGGGISIDKEYRTEGVSWWSQELPTYQECEEALANLESNGNKVDYIITHAAPESVARNELSSIKPMLGIDDPTEKFLEEILHSVDYNRWFCGHYHLDCFIKDCKIEVLYNNIIKLSKGFPIASRRIKSIYED